MGDVNVLLKITLPVMIFIIKAILNFIARKGKSKLLLPCHCTSVSVV
jgi:hypothetical protein